jgi:hypothetical protein
MRTLAVIAGMVFAAAAWAGDFGGVFGVVRDSGGRVLPDADVQTQSQSTGARWKILSDASGRYAFEGLAPGVYKVTVRVPGFRTVSKVGAVVDASVGAQVDFQMELLGLHEVITVASGGDPLDPMAGSTLLVARGSAGATLPASGPDYRVLFDLAPGVVITPASVADGGQFTSNGQRPNASEFRVDGVNANTGVGASSLPGAFPGASLPSMTAMGSTENLASPETTQTVELRANPFAPESGSRPGAEAAIATRSGSSEFHAEVFTHLRDGSWSARDWFANASDMAFPRPFFGSAGAVAGGPVFGDKKTFFFVSAQYSYMQDSALERIAVPSLAARSNAPSLVGAVLQSFPPPTGPDLGGGESAGMLQLGREATLQSYSLRIDRTLGSWGALFGRASMTPSTSDAAPWTSATQGDTHWNSFTVGLTAGKTAGPIFDARFNYSRSTLISSFSGDSAAAEAALLAKLLPSAVVISADSIVSFSGPQTGLGASTISALLPQYANAPTIWGITVPGLGEFISGNGPTLNARQDQWEFRSTISQQRGRNEFRAGLDGVRLEPSRTSPSASILGQEPSLQNFLASGPLPVSVSVAPASGGKVQFLSLFAQDSFRWSDSLTVLYGLRWELTPPTSGQAEVPTISGLWDATSFQTLYAGNIESAGPWPMRYGQIAPRLGLAYRMPFGGLVFRAGGGVFYDTALGAAVNPVNGAPFNSWMLTGGDGFTDGSALASGVANWTWSGSDADVQQFLNGPQPLLRLPTSYQWRASLNRRFGQLGTGSISYVGAEGKHLLGNEAYVDPNTGVLNRMVTLTENSSNYQALQGQYRGSIARHVFGSVSYTWSHSIDDASQDSSVFLIHPGYRLSEARGASSFDVRHTLTAALSYQVPHSTPAGRLPDWLSGWTVSGVFRVRSGFPIDIFTAEPVIGQDFDNVGRPNLVAGEPIWIADSSVPGHRRLNPAAFAVPANGAQGSLGRDTIYGNGLLQLDVSLRREFALWRRSSLETSLNIFNVPNHPAFADPVPYLSSPWFGQSTSMQNLMLGSGTPNTGLSPLFQAGGARSVELSFRFSF